MMVLSLSLLAIALLAVAATADAAAQSNHEWPELVYGNTNGREKRQIAEGGKHQSSKVLGHNMPQDLL